MLLLLLWLGWGMVAQVQTTFPALRTQALAAYHDKHYRESGQRYEQSFQRRPLSFSIPTWPRCRNTCL